MENSSTSALRAVGSQAIPVRTPAVSRLRVSDIILLLLVMAAWGGAFTAGRIAVVELSPMSVAMLRYLLASVLLVVVVARREGIVGSLARVDGRVWGELIALGLFSVVGYNVLLLAGLKYSTAVNGSLIAGLAPLATALLAAVVLRERLSRWQMIGMLVSLFGVAVLVTGGRLSALLALEFNRGDLLILASMLCFAAQAITARRVMRHMTPLATLAYSCLIGSVMLVPFTVQGLSSVEWAALGGTTWGALIYLGVFATVLAYLGWFQVVERSGAGAPAAFINLVPIFGAAIGFAWGEQVSSAHVASAVLVLLGVRLAGRKKS